MQAPIFRSCPHADALLAAIAPWLRDEPSPYSLLASVAARGGDGAWCGVIARDGGPVLALAQTPPWPVVVASPLPADAAAVAAAVAVLRDRSPVREVNGPRAWADAIAAASGAIVSTQGLRLHRLVGAPQLPRATVGEAGAFSADEIPLIQAWIAAFEAEADPNSPHRPSRVDEIRAGLADYLAWRVDGRPVAMARAMRRFQGGCSIGPVYTPPELRGRGYAGAVVQALCAQLLAGGSAYVALYTDLANPIANRLYERIGFVPVLDQLRVGWSTP